MASLIQNLPYVKCCRESILFGNNVAPMHWKSTLNPKATENSNKATNFWYIS